MAKQAMISAMEEVIGEFVLNIDKENLKIAALRGKLKLENVQLDGDLIAGHIMQSMGLSGFGILSCWAKSVVVTVPLKNLEREPTRIEVRGCHLLCLPLLPSTAQKTFGTGTLEDPRCTLRTRSKRCQLARFERMFMQGKLDEEGPVSKRIMRAVKEVERDQKRKLRKPPTARLDDSIEDDDFDTLLSGLNETDSETCTSATTSTEEQTHTTDPNSTSFRNEDIPTLPRDWKVKLREKIMRNLEASVHDLHFRCEVAEEGLDFCHPDHQKRGRRFSESWLGKQGLKYDQRAFAFGGTVENIYVRTANEKWEVGSHEKKGFSGETDHLGPHPYDLRHNKLISCENCCVYWDDDPPFLISETEIVLSSDHKVSGNKYHSKIEGAMEALHQQQEPGMHVRESMMTSKKTHTKETYPDRAHHYCLQGFNFNVRQMMSDRFEPGPISCQAEILPVELDIQLRPHQFVQYLKLKSAMLSQRQFDTMLRQRPRASPLIQPREWWKYAFNCVTTRPNSRPWDDIVQICRHRNRYIALIRRKLEKSMELDYCGFHGGLSVLESAELLAMEDLLPIEALMAFHLAALRLHTKSPKAGKPPLSDQSKSVEPRGRGIGRPLKRMFRRSRSRSSKTRQENYDFAEVESTAASRQSISSQSSVKTGTSLSLVEAMTVRLGRKVWMVHFKLFHWRVTVTLMSARGEDIVRLLCEGNGVVQFMGEGKFDNFFDVSRFEITDCQSGSNNKILVVKAPIDDDHPDDDSSKDLSLSSSFAVDPGAFSTFMDLPPLGVVCRLAAAREKCSTKLSLSAHPATLLWTRSCFDAVAEFFGAPTSEQQSELGNKLKVAATPLARKAQLAFNSQSTLMLHLNIDAPKIWIPFNSSKTDNGVMYVDSGTFRLSCRKADGQSTLNWNVAAKEIQVNFARWKLQTIQERIASPLPFVLQPSAQGVTYVVRPFEVHANSLVKDGCDALDMSPEDTSEYTGPVTFVDVTVSPVSLNLVDAEILARAIGKWYSQGILSVRGRVSTRQRTKDSTIGPKNGAIGSSTSFANELIPRHLSFTVEKLEMALEGHSKLTVPDEKSIDSHETSLLGELVCPTRTYVVEVFQIRVVRSSFQEKTGTKAYVTDASIVQVQGSDHTPAKGRYSADELQYAVLETRVPQHERREPKGVFSATLYSDKRTHLDEVEIDVDAVVLRVTPTSLKDCVKGIRKIGELVQLMTKEMERKVHEQGRKARNKDVETNGSEEHSVRSAQKRPISPAFSMTSEMSDSQKPEETSVSSSSDSSLLIKVTIRDGTLLAGRPTSARQFWQPKRTSRSRKTYTFAVVQVMSNALVMFQSVENPDFSGSRTVHISLDNLCASVNTAFDPISASQASPMIGPTGGEFRVANETENLGCVVSQHLSLDCEEIKSSLTFSDMSILISILKTMLQRLRGNQQQEIVLSQRVRTQRQRRIPLLSYQKKGTGIATSIRIEIHSVSFVVLRAFQTKYGAPEFVALNLRDTKASLSGCMSALSGEITAGLSVDFYNADVSDWEYAVEPLDLSLSVDQMPNEVVLEMATDSSVQLNLTGIFLRDFADLDFKALKDKAVGDKARVDALTPSALSTVGLRRATETHSVVLHNFSGFDIDVDIIDSSPSKSPEQTVRFDSFGPGIVRDSSFAALDSLFDGIDLQDEEAFSIGAVPRLRLKFPPSTADLLGEREPILGLPIAQGSSRSTYLLHPVSHSQQSSERVSDNTMSGEVDEVVPSNRNQDGQSQCAIEPVVEWCMQNQRLRSSVVDLYSIEKGNDMLVSSVWSPQEECVAETMPGDKLEDSINSEANGDIETSPGRPKIATSPTRKSTKSTSQENTIWVRPYLKNDSPEWTDMTCILRMARERVMLPDENWSWVNDWCVDVSGDFGISTDADGWEYQADFETFNKARRFYIRGDACRRRRWTRTRIVRPPTLENTSRLMKLVWETSRDENGNFRLEVKSHVTVYNTTASTLTFFVFSPSWTEEKNIGVAEPGAKLHVPVALASAVYLRLAKKSHQQSSLSGYATTDRIMILPTSYDSNLWIRTAMKLGDVSNTCLHFLVKLESKKGIVDITVKPVLRILNLLPCQLECQFGEVLQRLDTRQPDSRPSASRKSRIANVETLQVASGQEGKCVALNPGSKPHISLRVPGYKWSSWHRIVNRNLESYTWRPLEAEEDLQILWNQGDSDNDEEFKFTVHFDRFGTVGDPLVLVLGVEFGHTPIVRVYAQCWIVDKTGFGCRFCDSFTDLLGTVPDIECSRRSHLSSDDARDPSMKRDMNIQGHQWSIGMSGMSMYFSPRERIALCVEKGIGDSKHSSKAVASKWTNPIDISNVMPKTVFSVDEVGGSRRFELAISVAVAPGPFLRTRIITLIPRYQIVNLLKRELIVAQEGCLNAETSIPSMSSVPFHWERRSLPPKVRLGAPTLEDKGSRDFNQCWSSGKIQLDKVGITSMRLPSSGILPTKPMVVQAEVRLAAKDQSSAVVIVVWSATEQSNPLYLMRNSTSHTILCRQPLQDEPNESRTESFPMVESCGAHSFSTSNASRSGNGNFHCGAELAPAVMAFLGLDQIEEFVWVLRSGDVMCFGFDDPEKPHILEWACVGDCADAFDASCKKAFVEIDAMGSQSSVGIGRSNEVLCQIGAEHSTKVIEFSESCSAKSKRYSVGKKVEGTMPAYQNDATLSRRLSDGIEDIEEVAITFRLKIPSIAVSVIDNIDSTHYGREILLVQGEKMFFSFSQSLEGYHELEMILMSLQVDNHVPASIHPILVFCPRVNEEEPFLHLSAVRRLQRHSSTFVFRYAAFRMLEIKIFLDRRTAETIARFIKPLRASKEPSSEEVPEFVSDLTIGMAVKYARPDRRAPRDIERIVQTANSGRIYVEQLHLHPVRIALTFTQEWMDNQGTDSLMVFQFIRGMASIADAPLTFTSFVVGHVFEAPQELLRVITTHYSSQLTKQIFAILGSLAILGAPADFISNVGTGVRDFFYEPIQGAVHGPRQFIEGLEAGTQSLARGVFVGVVKGAANVTEVVNANLAGLTADDDFIHERKAHQRMLTDAMSRGITNRNFSQSLSLAGHAIARGVRSGAYGIVEQPTRHASKSGPVGFVKGVGKAMVGAIVKPVVGVGDAAALIMNHVSDATSNKQIEPKIPKRLRRALPLRSAEKPNCVYLKPYDERAAKAQKIVTGGESVDDVYIGHVNIPSHLIIASKQCLWAIDRRSREPWCVNWEEISHFGRIDDGMSVVVFSQSGLKAFVFQVEDPQECAELDTLLAMQLLRMGNAARNSAQQESTSSQMLEFSLENLPGIRSHQAKHVFGSGNENRKRLASSIKDEIDLIEQCFARVKRMSSRDSSYFQALDDEAWTLVSCWGQVFSGLSSRRCIAASIINGTGKDIQVKATKLLEGGSPCYAIPTREFDADQGILHAGGVIIFFGWGVVPSLLQPGNVFMQVETNAFIADLAEQKTRDTYVEAVSGHQVDFLEKSYDDAGWWAKYWILVRNCDT